MTCSICRLDKPADAFSIDGRTNKPRRHCKRCRCEVEAARRMANPEQKRSTDRRYYAENAERLCAYQRTYRRNNRARLREYFRDYGRRFYREVIQPASRRWQARNPEKLRAHRILWSAIRKGVVSVKDRCEDCGAARPVNDRRSKHIEAHHCDYTKPLEVRWLCKPCHFKADLVRRDLERRAGAL